MSADTDESPEGNVSTGQLPRQDEVRGLLVEAYERYRSVAEGVVADYNPALARVPADLFGACIVSADGRTVAAGDSTHRFSIQSVSKPFVFALVCDAMSKRASRASQEEFSRWMVRSMSIYTSVPVVTPTLEQH